MATRAKTGPGPLWQRTHGMGNIQGDSFQLQTTPKQALEASVYIKACIKQTRGMDVRIAIGLGEKLMMQEK